MLAGLSTIVIATGALIRGPAVIRAWLDRLTADADEARARAQSLREDADERRLERFRQPADRQRGGREDRTGWSGARVGQDHAGHLWPDKDESTMAIVDSVFKLGSKVLRTPRGLSGGAP
jgi:hypothetical protein